jgi:hypothetical protein
MTATLPALLVRAAAPIQHASSNARVQTDRAARAVSTAIGTARLAATGLDAATLDELLAFRDAVLARYRTLGTAWSNDWANWYDYVSNIKGTNTMSKLAEKESNILCQFAQMIGTHMRDLVTLQENVEVNYAYWLTQKLENEAP